MAFVPLRPEIVQKIVEQRLKEVETQQWVGEVAHLEEEGKKPKPKYVLITEVCMYVFTRESIKAGKAAKRTNLEAFLELTDATATGEDCVIKFKSGTYHFSTPEAGAIVTNVLTQLRVLFWNINPVLASVHSPLLSKP
jgi:hypothetical protein